MASLTVIVAASHCNPSLSRTLEALHGQVHSPEVAEVFIATEDHSHPALETLQQYATRFGFRVLTRDKKDQASVRNRAAAQATGELLLFLDGDLEPTSSLIEAHIRAHQNMRAQVAIGPRMPAPNNSREFVAYDERAWWSDRFYWMQHTGHRFSYRDFLGGNFSVSKDLFASLGGFDEEMAAYDAEDYDLGARLIKSKSSLIFVPSALAFENQPSSVCRSLERERRQGRADVLVGQQHPELRSTLPLVDFQKLQSSFAKLMYALASRYTLAGDPAATLLQWMLTFLERAKLRSLWSRIFLGLRHYWYLRSAAEQLGSSEALLQFLQGIPSDAVESAQEIEIDLSDGLEAGEQKLDRERPWGIRLRYRDSVIGRVPSQPGAEPLRAEHLRPALAFELCWPFLMALMLEIGTEDINGLQDHRH